MAVFAATDFKITIGTVNLSSSIKSVELSLEADDKDITTFGTGWRSRTGGLKQGTVKIDFLQDYAAGSVEATLYPLLGTIATVTILPTSGTASATNPSYAVPVLCTQVQPVSGAVGDIATQSVTWPTNGTVTKTP